MQHHVDPALGVYVIDRYTYHALEFLEGVQPGSTKTMGQFVSLSDVWGDVWCNGWQVCFPSLPPMLECGLESRLRLECLAAWQH